MDLIRTVYVARAIDFISARGFSLSNELIMVRGILKGTL